MTAEQETAVTAPAERTPVEVIGEQTARLQEAMLVVRQRVQQRVSGMNAPPEVQAMLQALRIPALTLGAEAASREIVRYASWDGDAADYTDQGLRRQAERMQEKTMQWFTTLREQLDRLIGARLISREEANIALQAVGAPAPPPVPQVQVHFTVVGNASAPASALNGHLIPTDETLRQTAQEELRRAITDVTRRYNFTVDGEIAIEVGVTRS